MRLFLCTRPRVRFAWVVMFFICVFHLRSAEEVIRRYLAFVCVVISVDFIYLSVNLVLLK